VIFVAVAVGLRLVAIGRAKNVAARLEVLRAASPAEVTLIKVLAGGTRESLELRLRFRAHHDHSIWYFYPPIAAAIASLERIELVEVLARCPRCGRPKSEDRAEWRSRYCISCSQKNRWQRLTPSERAAGVVAMLESEPRERSRAKRAARLAELRARANERSKRTALPECVDCAAVLPVRRGESPKAKRRCRSCGMKRAWQRPGYRQACARGRAAFLARKAAT
jgi:hypothetical protein